MASIVWAGHAICTDRMAIGADLVPDCRRRRERRFIHNQKLIKDFKRGA